MAVCFVLQISLDDGLLRATVALRLGQLLTFTGDNVNAVQVLRSGLATVQAARDALLSQPLHNPTRSDDQLALSCASIACFCDAALSAAVTSAGIQEAAKETADTLDLLSKRPGAGAYGGSGLFGAESQVRRARLMVLMLSMLLLQGTGCLACIL